MAWMRKLARAVKMKTQTNTKIVFLMVMSMSHWFEFVWMSTLAAEALSERHRYRQSETAAAKQYLVADSFIRIFFVPIDWPIFKTPLERLERQFVATTEELVGLVPIRTAFPAEDRIDDLHFFVPEVFERQNLKQTVCIPEFFWEIGRKPNLDGKHFHR